jgi:hypothetical protein
LVQVNTATAASGVYTFTVPISSAELQTWLATATSQSYVAIQITDTANGIATTPLLCQITANQNDSGTTPTSANGTLSVAAGKTVTFPQSLTFPSDTGTDNYQLTTNGAGVLTWEAGGALTDGDKGEITVSASGATWTIDNDVVTLAKLAHMDTARVIGRTTAGTGSPELLTISGTGSVAMTTNPQFTTPSLGAATATTINGSYMPVNGVTAADRARAVATFVTETELDVAVVNGATYRITYTAFWLDGGATATVEAQLLFPATVTRATGGGTVTDSSTVFAAGGLIDGTTPAQLAASTLTGSYAFLEYTLVFTAGVTGTINFQWRPATADTITLQSGATVRAERIA